MENEKLLEKNSRVKILQEMIDAYKNNEDKFTRGMGAGMEIALKFLMKREEEN